MKKQVVVKGMEKMIKSNVVKKLHMMTSKLLRDQVLNKLIIIILTLNVRNQMIS